MVKNEKIVHQTLGSRCEGKALKIHNFEIHRRFSREKIFFCFLRFFQEQFLYTSVRDVVSK